MEGNDRLISSSKGRVPESFLINQQMSTFTFEIRIESGESASVPRCRSIAQICAGQLHQAFGQSEPMGRETLPPGWEQRRSAKGSTYYVCLHSMRSQWTRPTAPLQEQAGANSARPTNVRWETDAHGEPSPVRAMGGDRSFSCRPLLFIWGDPYKVERSAGR